ncbi:hypothetical protein EWB00_004733, partial [Schistosoma japonicum]
MYNLLIWHQEVEVVKFLGEMHSAEEDFLQLPNEKLSELKQFPCHNLVVNRLQITSSGNKHSALINNTETYINLKRHKQHELFDASTLSVNTIQCDRCKTQCNTISYTNTPSQRLPVIISKPNEDKQHELNRNKERERLSTVDQQTIVIDVLAEQKSLTVDKEIVINSTSRQMDH